MQESFRGSLSAYRLKLLVPALFEGTVPVAGTLRLWRGPTRREFLIRDGSVVAALSNDPSEHLAQVLSDLRILDATRAAMAFAAAKSAGVPLGAFLLERGFLDRPRLQEALEHKARESFFDCYQWESGEVEWQAIAPPQVTGAELRLKLGPLHRDAMARLREWRAIRELFPDPQVTFRAYPALFPERGSDEERELVRLAQEGATFEQLLQTAREGKLFAARRVMHLYRRGVLVRDEVHPPPRRRPPDLEQSLALARSSLADGDPDAAMQLATRVLELAPVPEAHGLYREAERALFGQIELAIFGYEGRLRFEPLPRAIPPELTADDLYLYSHLKAHRSVREGLKSAAMGELGAYRALLRLIANGIVSVTAQARTARPEYATVH